MITQKKGEQENGSNNATGLVIQAVGQEERR